MAQLVDQYGRPVKRQELTTPKASVSVTGVRQPWAQSVASGLTPERLARILRDCDEGALTDYAILAEEMEERDPHYASVLGTRKRAVSGVEAIVKPASEDPSDEKFAALVREQITENPRFPDLVEDLLDAIGKGFSVVELNWASTPNSWTIDGWEQIEARFLTLDRETGRELRLIDDADPLNGVPLTPFQHVIHRPRLKSGPIQRGGLARLVAFSWMCKSYTLKDWMAFAETYGLPLRLGRYGPGATQKDIEALFLAVSNIGTDAAAVLPDSARIEFAQASGSQSEAVFENLARYLDEQVSKAVLGQTMTSDNGSSQSQAEIHNEVRHDIARADARQVSATLTEQIAVPLIELNHGVQARYPRIEIVVEEAEDLDLILKHTATLAERGLKVRAQEVRAKLGYSDPEDDDEVIGGTPTAAAQTALARLMSTTAAAIPEPRDEIDDLTAELMDDWRPVMDETLDPILAAIEEADGFEDMLAKLSALGELPSADFINRLVTAMVKARAVGDVKDG